MIRRPYFSRFECGHPGCSEFAHYESDTRAEQAGLYEKYANEKWRCIRHSKPDEVLSAVNNCIVTEITSKVDEYEGRNLGMTFGFSGFTSGPGFKAFANDFPAGTTIRVTAEVLLPNPPLPQPPGEDR